MWTPFKTIFIIAVITRATIVTGGGGLDPAGFSDTATSTIASPDGFPVHVNVCVDAGETFGM